MDDIFTEKQKEELEKFLTLSKKIVYNKKIPPAYLIYMLSKFPNDNHQNIYTKVNKVLLRDTLNKKKRLYLDFMVKND
jgi:hypothetical protein